MRYRVDKGVNDAVRPPKGGPAEARDHIASSLPLLISAHSGQSQQQINAIGLDTQANLQKLLKFLIMAHSKHLFEFYLLRMGFLLLLFQVYKEIIIFKIQIVKKTKFFFKISCTFIKICKLNSLN